VNENVFVPTLAVTVVFSADVHEGLTVFLSRVRTFERAKESRSPWRWLPLSWAARSL
jgi:hypothetical protein